MLPTLPPLAFLLAEVVVAAWRNEHDTITPRLVRISAGAGAFICVLAVGIAGHNARGSAEPLAKVIRPQLQADDTFVSLHAYPFDLALYMRAIKPSWVVDDWLNPEIATRDNWRKELYDAAKFDPAVGKQVLISNEEFNARLCAAPDGARYWVWGSSSDGTDYPALQGLTPVASSIKFLIWKVEAGPALRQRVCGGTPKPADHEGQHGQSDQDQGEQHVIADRRGVQQPGIGALVDQKARGRHEEETSDGYRPGYATMAERKPVVSNEGHRECDQPADQVGDQRRGGEFDAAHGHRPVRCGGSASDGDKNQLFEQGAHAGVQIWKYGVSS